jgi:hypothetical protein
MTSKQQTSVLCLVLVCVAISGCVITPPDISISFLGDVETAGNQVQVDGSIGDSMSDNTYHDVRLYSYDDEKKLLQVTPVGDLTGRLEVSMTIQPIPKYIIIYSDDFWENEDTDDFWETRDVTVMYLERMENGNYSRRGQATSPDELPVNPAAG